MKNFEIQYILHFEPTSMKMIVYMVVHNIPVFMHDGAPCHILKLVSEFIRKNKVVKVLHWPRNCEEMNSIKNLELYKE